MAQAISQALPVELRSLLTGLSSADVSDDQQWIVAVMRKEGPTVVHLLWRMLGSQEDVMDAYQTAVCRLTAHGSKGIGSNRAGYFYRTAMNAGIELLRSRKRRRTHWPVVCETQTNRYVSQTESGSGEHRESLQRMRRAICELPPHLRSVVILRDLAELPYAQVARYLGIRQGTARLYRRHAIVRLADTIGREVDE